MYLSDTGGAFNEGYAHWEAVTIGGQTKDGYDAVNELTYILLKSKREFPLNYPNLAARIHSRSPKRYLYEVAETIKAGEEQLGLQTGEFEQFQSFDEHKFDLVISEIRITGMDGLQLLRRVKQEGLCNHFVLCSEFADFQYARQGIILGAYDYFVKPLEAGMFYSVFARIRSEADEKAGRNPDDTEKIWTFFENQDDGIFPYMGEFSNRIYKEAGDVLAADKRMEQIFTRILNRVFEKYTWMELYLSKEDFITTGNIHESEKDSYESHIANQVIALFEEYKELYPNVRDERIEEVILYILHHPEEDVKQKTIATRYYLNTSYLSTIFTAHTEQRFVDYLTVVKLKRAAFLLKKNRLKVIEIAARLHYKDVGYFSRLFKKKYGITPSEFRNQEQTDYQI